MRTGSLNHPGGCIGYRVEFGGRAVALISDTEHVEGELDPTVLALIENADLVIYDCTYTDEEMDRIARLRPLDLAAGRPALPGRRRASGWRCSITIRSAPTRDGGHRSAGARRRFPGAFAARRP